MNHTPSKAKAASSDASHPINARRLLRWGGLILVLACVFTLGRLSHEDDRAALSLISELSEQLEAQQKTAEILRNDHDAEARAMAVRLAELQASSLRLDALGERLVQMGQLDASEFDFSQPAAVGGPDEELEPGTAEGSDHLITPGMSELTTDIEAYQQRLYQQEVQLEALAALLNNRRLQAESTPAGWPIGKGWISSRYGTRTDPFTGHKAWHNGIDFSGPMGAEVVSVASGVVTWAGSRAGYGLAIDIDHGNGYVTRYAHNSELKVAVGDRVKSGETIALMGATGRATSHHVHFEVLENGRPIDPSRLVRELRS